MRGVRFSVRLLLAILSIFAVAGPATAQDEDFRTASGSLVRFGSVGSGFQEVIGQVVTVPPGQTRLMSFGFYNYSVPTSVTFQGRVHAWDATAQAATGPALFTGPSVSVPGANQTFDISTGGVTVTPGQQYVVFLVATSSGSDSGFLEARGDVYAGGRGGYRFDTNFTTGPWSAVGLGAGEDMAFAVDFEPPAPIPTLTEWAMILLTLALASAGAVMLQRRPARARV